MDKNQLDNIGDNVLPLASSSNLKLTNEKTLWRRAWIDMAVEAVHSRLLPESSQPPKAVEQPKLYVAWSRSEDRGD
jgi:hypothetical protein